MHINGMAVAKPLKTKTCHMSKIKINFSHNRFTCQIAMKILHHLILKSCLMVSTIGLELLNLEPYSSNKKLNCYFLHIVSVCAIMKGPYNARLIYFNGEAGFQFGTLASKYK